MFQIVVRAMYTQLRDVNQANLGLATHHRIMNSVEANVPYMQILELAT